MKIVNYDEFVRMPAGTIFAPYEPCIFKEEFGIKTDTGEEWDIPNAGKKWLFNGVMPLRPWLGESDLTYVGAQEDASFEIYDGDNNDYDEDGMFAILEEQDIKKLIDVLQWALKGCYGKPPETDSGKSCGNCVYCYGHTKCSLDEKDNACDECDAFKRIGECPCTKGNFSEDCPYFEEE